MSIATRFYTAGAIILLALFLLPLLRLPPTYTRLLLSALVFSGYGALAVAVTIEAVKFLSGSRASIAAKAALGVLVAGATTASTVLARHQVNELVGTDPSKFPIAVSILALAMAPLVWVTIIFFVAATVMILLLLWLAVLWLSDQVHLRSLIISIRNSTAYRVLMRKPRYEDRGFSPVPLLARILGVFGVILLLSVPVQAIETYRGTFQRAFATVVVHSEFFSRSSCRNVQQGEIAAFISDTNVSVATLQSDGSYRFEVRACATD